MDDEQELVAALLRSMPPPDVRGDVVARVNERIDAAAGWLGLTDFRAWTLGLAPAVCALVLAALFWAVPSQSAPAMAGAAFSPSSSIDWQEDVSGDALLDAALTLAGARDAR
jgi:hypothetical protein